MPATDAMLARLQAELEEQRTFDRRPRRRRRRRRPRPDRRRRWSCIKRARDRIAETRRPDATRCGKAPASRSSRRNRTQRTASGLYAAGPRPAGRQRRVPLGRRLHRRPVLRPAGRRTTPSSGMEVFHRAAAHQTTADNPGLLPETIVAPIVNFIEVARPLVATLGPTDLGPGAWSYARVTQHTQVGKQAGEKTELASPQDADHQDARSAPTRSAATSTCPSRTSTGRRRRSSTWSSTTSPSSTRSRPRRRRPTCCAAAATAGPVIPTGPPTAADVADRDLDGGRVGVRRHQGPGPHRRRRVPRHARR